VTLAGGASQKVTFTTTEATAGTYTFSVDSLSASLTVNAITKETRTTIWWIVGAVVLAILVAAAIAITMRRRSKK